MFQKDIDLLSYILSITVIVKLLEVIIKENV